MFSDMIVVSGRQCFGIHAAGDPDSLTCLLTITLDGRVEWTFDVPTWRPMSVGAAGDTWYVWSARDVIVLPPDEAGEPAAFKVDEDLQFVFRLDDGWVLVCETSIRRLVNEHETDRWELPEIVSDAAWIADVLSVRDYSGSETRVRVSGPRFLSPGG